MRRQFDEQLEELAREMISMGAMIESAIDKACDALMRHDVALAKSVMEADHLIDQKERTIESMCLRLLLIQQPIARDLRKVSSALKMITDMERIGDQAEDISEITIRLIDEQYIDSLQHIPAMAHATTRMVTGAIDAFVARALDRARAVIACDDIVDDLFVQVKDDLIRLIRADSANGEQAIDLIMVAKYFERIGDHATNIAEWVVFSITGEHGNERII